tara:strand:- start:2096 stop:2653 length:558 start_codon:yes stop_codon:yes gene_type:complete
MSKSTITDAQRRIIRKKVATVSLPKGTILYRTQPKKCTLKAMVCEDTGKKGCYFSNDIYIPLGMILEYNKPMYLCKYVTKKEITFYVGKYSFRSLEPRRFYKSYKDCVKENFIINIDPKRSYNHFEDHTIPDHEMFFKDIWFDNFNGIEYFIVNPRTLKRLEPVFDDVITVKKAKEILDMKEKSF